MQDNTREVAKKMCKALVKSKGHPYAVGYIESYLVDVIDKYVTDPSQKTLLHIEMLNIAIDNQIDRLDKKEA